MSKYFKEVGNKYISYIYVLIALFLSFRFIGFLLDEIFNPFAIGSILVSIISVIVLGLVLLVVVTGFYLLIITAHNMVMSFFSIIKNKK